MDVSGFTGFTISCSFLFQFYLLTCIEGLKVMEENLLDGASLSLSCNAGLSFFWFCVSFQARPSSDAEDGPTTLSYVWGTNINVPDVTNAIARFLQNYRTSPEDMEAKYIQLIEQVGFGVLLQSIGDQSVVAS
jgi:hypothetical protein